MIQGHLFNRNPFGDPVDDPYLINDTYDNLTLSTIINGGFEKVTLTIPRSVQEMWDWYQNRLGYLVVFNDETTDEVFRGLIWAITLDLGGGATVKRSLANLYNRVAVDYDRQILGQPERAYRDRTPIVEDLASQAEFGIKEIRVTGGPMDDIIAVNRSNVFLAEHAWPRHPQPNWTIPINDPNISMTVDILGLWVTFGYRIYEQIAISTPTIRTLIRAIVSGTLPPLPPPIGGYYSPFASHDTHFINGNNATLATVHSFGGYTCKDFLEMLVGLGNDPAVNFNRMYIAVWEEDRVYVDQIPVANDPATVPTWYFSHHEGKVYDTMGCERPLHRVRAADVVEILDVPYDDSQFVAGRTQFETETGQLTMTPFGGGDDIETMISTVAPER